MSDPTPARPESRILNARTDPRDRAPAPGELEAAASSWGPHARTVRAGALAIELRGLDDRLAALVDSQYAGFVESQGAVFQGPRRGSLVEVLRSPVPRWLHLPRGEGRAEEARVGARSDETSVELWSYGFASRFDRDGREARLYLCEGDDRETAQAVENHLRFFVAAAALSAGSFLLHSSGVARGGKAWLFFGPSGAGKSTTASNAPEGTELLGDDLVLVERGDEEAWCGCGVPFRGSHSRGPNSATRAKVAMACRVIQAQENALEEVSRSLQVTELLAQVPFLMDDAASRDRAGHAIEGFVKDVPVRRLKLRNDPSYWELLKG